MYTSSFSIFALAATAIHFVAAQDASAQKVGWTGKLSSLDGGLGGTIKVVDSKTLTISDYQLKDASAPALYWWGTTDGVIKDGFRISNEQVTQKATSNSLTIMLDAGKTPADFSTVGLWCERLNANFGQATLAAATGNTTGPASTSGSMTSATTAAASPSKTGAGAMNTVGWTGGAFGAAVMVAALLL
jgi:hypothetical protein